ncbi:unnamed protein product [Ceutorhynchus assimilis]|uniref:Cytochrome P450 n=1 Tax=Ceutorhynchus assimilis TaxID=467358 RepID=A0A9N9MTW6_9CUCU|nr:unnamed protein product [Ceutorhynchus assimilis]
MLWIYTIIILVAIVYAYCTRNFNYWKTRNVPFLKPIPFLGNLWPTLKMQQTLGEWLCDKCRETNQDYFGIYVLDQPVLVVQSPKMIKQILQKDFVYFQNRSASVPRKNLVLSSNLFFAKNTKWKMVRSHVTPVFSSGKIKLMFAHILNETTAMIDYIDGLVNMSDVESKEICAKYSTNVIAKCAFGVDAKSFESEQAEFRKLGRRIFDFRYSTAIRQFTCFLFPNIVQWFNISVIDDDTLARLKIIFLEVYNSRLSSGNFEGNDLVDILIEATKNLPEFDENVLLGQAIQFFLAGFETTGSILSFTLYELCLDQEIQEKLREEIFEITKKHNNSITYESISEMKYLDMCVTETLRKYPSVPFLDRVTDSTYKIAGTDIILDKGIPIYIPLFGVHYNPDIYPDPHKYNPERFRDKSRLNKESLTYLPFGEGPRICIGIRFGLLVVKLGLIAILQKFKLEATDNTPIPMKFASRSIVLQADKGIPLKFVPLK